MNQMLKEKLFLVALVLGLLTAVAAAGVMNMRKEGKNTPYRNSEEAPGLLAEETEPLAGASDAALEQEHPDRALAARENPDTVIAEQTYGAVTEKTAAADGGQAVPTEAVEADSGLEAAAALVLDFTDQSRLQWPVRGNVLLGYSMDTTVYFPTLDQYKCNPAMVIQGDVSLPVYAPANARVLEAGSNEEIGNYLELDLGNGYTAVCGQLKEVQAVGGEYLEKGQLLGYLAEPTKYYSVEGANLYFELLHEGKPVDPLDHLE